MKTVQELESIKQRFVASAYPLGSFPKDLLLELVDQAIADRKTINTWLGFLRLMAQRSSWRDSINEHIDEYLYGTTDQKVIEAAKQFIERSRLHDRTNR